MKELFVFRGVPGSGKSTAAAYLKKQLIEDGFKADTFEADNYFVDPEGNYNWNPDKLDLAHKWCFEQVESALKDHDKVIVSNTNLVIPNMVNWLNLAKKYKAKMIVYRMKNQFKNVHDVPADKVAAMKNRLRDWRGEIMLGRDYVYAAGHLLNLNK